MISVELNWSSAEVDNGTLEVELRGERPKGWKRSFERTVALLPGGEWGKVSLKKSRVRVHGVAEGGEDRLHHFLESVVLQANTAHEPREPKAHEDEHHAEEDSRDPLDVEMTERFRSFAGEPDG